MITRRELVLVADDDQDIVRFVEVNLRLEGYEVATAGDGEQALQGAYDLMPDLVLLDVMMPKIDGFEVCQRLRGDARTKHMSVIMLTAKSLSADKVVGLTAGADDYMIKPFDPMELVARVKSALRRSREMRAVNPLTQLPGNVQVQEEVAKRVALGAPFALMYVDLDNFKAFNDCYGFLRGDEVITLLATAARRAVMEAGEPAPFLGHIGGDDFVVVSLPEQAEPLAKRVVDVFDSSAPRLHDQGDADRGYIEVTDRQGKARRFPLVSVSIGIAMSGNRMFADKREVVDVATEMKKVAKTSVGSSVAVDRRATPRPPG